MQKRTTLLFIAMLILLTAVLPASAYSPDETSSHVTLNGSGGSGTVTAIQAPFDVVVFNISLHNMDVSAHGSTYWVYYNVYADGTWYTPYPLAKKYPFKRPTWGNSHGKKSPSGFDYVPEPMTVNSNGHGSARYWKDVGWGDLWRIEVYSDSDLTTPVLVSDSFPPPFRNAQVH